VRQTSIAFEADTAGFYSIPPPVTSSSSSSCSSSAVWRRRSSIRDRMSRSSVTWQSVTGEAVCTQLRDYSLRPRKSPSYRVLAVADEQMATSRARQRSCTASVIEDNMSDISCLVDEHGHASAGDINALDPDGRLFADKYLKYEYDVATRTSARTPSDRDPLFTQDWAAADFFDRCAGTAEKLMAFAGTGALDNASMARLLRPDKRQTYLDACGTIEKAIVTACAAKGEPCLEEGCATEGETCLEACLAAGEPYHTACASAWIELFKDPNNRIDAWRK
jgi:hypothetical protein